MKNIYDQANDLQRNAVIRRNIGYTIKLIQGAFWVVAISYISFIALALAVGSVK